MSDAVAMNLKGVRDPAVDGPQGDAIPFFFKGQYHLYYLEAPPGKFDQPDRGRTPWRHLVSSDLLHWDDLGIVLPLGTGDDPDIDGIWTGSVVGHDGVLYIFYTGGRRSAETPQTICQATSSDGITFVKDARNPVMLPATEWFENRDWRDPYVFWHPAKQEYWMLVSGRLKNGPPARRGIVSLSTSPDLVTWTTHAEPFYAPGNTYCMECPEVFELGGKWRMIFSRFSEYAATVYREADALTEPWRTPTYPALDGARWYAAKSLADDRGRRIAFGWVHDRRGFNNQGEWLWGGDMCLPREIYVGADDRLCMRLPDEFEHWLDSRLSLGLTPVVGKLNGGRAGEAGASAVVRINVPATPAELCCLSVQFVADDARGGLGLLLFCDPEFRSGLRLFVDTAAGIVSLGDLVAGGEPDRLPEPLVQNAIAPRPSGTLQIDVYLRGDTLEIFLDRAVALTHRFYGKRPFTAAAFVEDGAAEIAASWRSHG